MSSEFVSKSDAFKTEHVLKYLDFLQRDNEERNAHIVSQILKAANDIGVWLTVTQIKDVQAIWLRINVRWFVYNASNIHELVSKYLELSKR